MDCNYIKYLLRLFFRRENALVYRYLKSLRRCEFHTNNSGVIHKLLAKLYSLKLQIMGTRYHIFIPINKCGYGLRIIHLTAGGVLLNVNSVGNYCGFNSGTVIGNVGIPTARPTLGNNVSFGPGAKAFGSIVIGDNVFVAPNAVVTKDVQNNCIVGGVPARILKMKS